MPLSRRDALAILGSAAAVGIGGCQSTNGGSHATVDTSARTDAPTATGTESAMTTPTDPLTDAPDEGGVMEAISWGPAPTALDLNDGYALAVTEPASILTYERGLSTTLLKTFQQDLSLPGVDTFGSLDRVVLVAGAINVYEGPIEPEPLTEQLIDSGYNSNGSLAGYDLYSSNLSAAAIGDGAFVLARKRGTALSISAESAVTTAIEAKSGDSPTLVSANPDVKTALDTVGDGAAVSVRPDTPQLATVDGVVAEAYRWRFGADETNVRAAFVFDETADASGVESWASQSDDFAETTPTVESNGRIATATAEVPTVDVTDVTPDWKSPTASRGIVASFSFDYDVDNQTLVIAHDGGDAVTPAALYVRGNGFADVAGVDQTGSGSWKGTTNDEGKVARGDEVVVGATTDHEIRLVYENDERSQVLGVSKGPDA